MNAINVTGMRFGKLTVIGRSEKTSSSGALWVCICDCGGKTVTTSLKLRNGHTSSCGCLRINASQSLIIHGQANKSPTYRSWKEMRQRCLNPKSDKWKWYGGRGIKICDQWSSYMIFLADMGERPLGMTIDRIDNNGNYEPTNCMWATQLDQTRKQEKNVLTEEIASQLRVDREYGMTYQALSEKYGISKATAHRCVAGKTWAIVKRHL